MNAVRALRWSRARVFGVVLPFVLAACGNGDGAPPAPPPGSIRTLAYVVSECHETAIGESPVGSQKLLIQNGDATPITVAEFPILGPPAPFGTCFALGVDRFGVEFVLGGIFQRLKVSPDGSAVVFEVTDGLALCDANICLTPPALPPEQQGLYYIRNDGTGLRRLGPPSSEPIFYSPANAGTLFLPSLAISPNGRFGVLTDKGVGTDGGERTQIFTIDLTNGARNQVTQLPDAPPSPEFPPTCCPGFANDDLVSFASSANPNGLNPDNELSFFIVNRDGAELTRIPTVAVSPDSTVVPIFTIRQDQPSVTIVLFPEQAQSGPPGQVQELLLVQGVDQLVQLTNLGRSDTSNPVLSSDGRRVFFVASADPLGTNPTHNCQVFAIDTFGSNLQQLTAFSEAQESTNGCLFGPQGNGCAIFLEQQDSATQTLILYSSCDPFGTNPNGTQIFTMLPDGSDLRQLTDLRGLVAVQGEISLQAPSQLAYQGLD